MRPKCIGISLRTRAFHHISLNHEQNGARKVNRNSTNCKNRNYYILILLYIPNKP